MPRIQILANLVLTMALSIVMISSSGSQVASAPPGADVNRDGIVNLFDLVIVAAAYNPGAPALDVRADANQDGVVNLFDLVLVAASLNFSPVTVPPAVPPVSTLFPDKVYVLQEERLIGRYALRIWTDVGDDWPYDHILTIAAVGQPSVQIEQFLEFDALSGQDITGEGHPDAIIRTFSGGAHCCGSTIVYDLGAAMAKVLETPQSNCGTKFEQLDGDRALECQTCDDVFAYAYCCYAGSPMVDVVLDYTPGQGYVPASPRFAYLYVDDIAEHIQLAQQAIPGQKCENDDTTKCAVLPLVLDYLYSGFAQQAWSELYRLYPYPDVAAFRADAEQRVYTSPLFVAQ